MEGKNLRAGQRTRAEKNAEVGESSQEAVRRRSLVEMEEMEGGGTPGGAWKSRREDTREDVKDSEVLFIWCCVESK